MSQSNIGVGFDLIWQTTEARQQLDEFQTALQQMADNASNLQIAIPVVMEDQLTAQADALIAEIQSTRSITIPVNMVPSDGGFIPGGSGGGASDAAIEAEADGNFIPALGFAGLGGTANWMRGSKGIAPQYATPGELIRDNAEYHAAKMAAAEQEASELAAADSSRMAAMEDAAAEARAAGALGERGLNQYGGVGEAPYGPFDEAAEAEAGAGFMGGAIGAFGVVMAGRRLWGLTREDLKLNRQVDFTDNPSADNAGVAGGVSETTKQAREALKAFQDENTGFFAEPASAIRSGFAKAGNWYAGRQAYDTDDSREQALQEALTASQQTDERQKLVDREIRADKTFQREAQTIEDEPSKGGNRFSDERSEISSHYRKLEDALEADYQATRQSAEDTEAYRAASQKLVDDKHAALQKVTEAESAQALQTEARTASERAILAGDPSASKKAELIGRVGEEYQDRLSRDGQAAADQWYRDVGRRQITQGEQQIDTQSRIADEEAGSQRYNAVRSALDFAGEESSNPDQQYAARRDETAMSGQNRIQHLRDEAEATRDLAEAKRLNNQADAEQTALDVRLGAMDSQHAKEKARQLADIQEQTQSTELRAQGHGQQADLMDLEASIKKKIDDAPDDQKSALRKLGEAQIDQFMHQQSGPFMGSMDQFQEQLQMSILKNDPSAMHDAAAFKAKLQGDDAAASKTQSAAEKFEEAGERLLPVIKSLASIAIIEAF